MKRHLIIKGIMLWFTAISSILFLCGGLELLVNSNHITIAIVWLFINVLLAIACTLFISYRDFYVVSGSRFIYGLLEDREYKKYNKDTEEYIFGVSNYPYGEPTYDDITEHDCMI